MGVAMITLYQVIRIKQLAYECVLAVNKLRSASSMEEALLLKQKMRDAKDALDAYIKEIGVE
jgi:hypothetical protein|nr:MAG TPA: hypothetical protein [Caudoviricetes sp.]